MARVELRNIRKAFRGHVALGGTPRADVVGADQDRAGVGSVQPRDQPQRGGLSGAGGSEEDE